MLLGRNFDDIDRTTIQGLVDAAATESVHLDFKRETYGRTEDDKKEFLKDITAFANCLGGHLIIGIEEADGVAAALSPLAGIDVDAELLRLESIARTGIEPSIIGLRMKRVPTETGDLIIIHVPRSYNPPHRVITRNSNRYYSRNSTGVFELSLEELRQLFGQRRSIEERAKSFLGERHLRIQANDGPLRIPVEQGAVVLHLVPLPDFGADRRVEIEAIRAQRDNFPPLGAQPAIDRINLDGIVCSRGGDVCHGYTQIFRNGSVEATNASVIGNLGGGRALRTTAVAEQLIAALSFYMRGLRALDMSTPVLVQISFFGMSNVSMALPAEYFDPPPPYTRDELHLPPSVISDYQIDDNYERFVAEQMDYLWNAYGFPRCDLFNGEGQWVGILRG